MRPVWRQGRVREFAEQLPSDVENRVLGQHRSLLRRRPGLVPDWFGEQLPSHVENLRSKP